MDAFSILVVDDEKPIVDLIASYLNVEGYTVHRAYDGQSALTIAQQTPIDLIILDIMLPGLDGIEVCRRLQANEQGTCILMLTARTEEVDKLIGLSVGADDYVTKPFSPRELVARVKAILRRTHRPTPGIAPQPVVRSGRLVIDPGKREVWNADALVELTPREFALLSTLARQPGYVFSREELLRLVWGSDFAGIDRVVDVHIGTLRRKLDDEALMIQTVRGVGYKFVDEPVAS